MNNLKENLIKLNFSKEQLNSIIQNKRIVNNFKIIINTIGENKLNLFKDNHNLLYLLTQKKDLALCNNSYIKIILDLLENNKIDSKKRLIKTLEYLDNNIEPFDIANLKKAIGIGVQITNNDIRKRVQEIIVLDNIDDWTKWGCVLGKMNKEFEWANGTIIKQIVNEIFADNFGVRDLNIKKNKKKKKKNNKKNVRKNFLNPKLNKQLYPKLLEDHLKQTGGKYITRFPPEPNGHLHIGHAKALYVNYSCAKDNDGLFFLRLDDTNPQKEKKIYFKSIIEDVAWLGYEPTKITSTSNYFDKLIKFAFDLIKNDKAYVCELNKEEFQIYKHNYTESPYRSRPIEESLSLFKKMINGDFKDGEYVLRLKIDMSSNNPNMRDPIAYRIINKNHPITKDKYKIYPSYDYSHCIVDSLENITHSLCSMEFQTRNEPYRWVLDQLKLYKPPQIEYIRLDITHTILSKRKLIKLINNKYVDGWDDPRLPTIKGMKRRGYTANAINNFCKKIGINIAGSTSVVKYELLEACVRKDLEEKAKRKLAVINPIKVIITNLDEPVYVNAKDYPNMGNKSPTRRVMLSNEIFINGDDFRLNADDNYFRLTLNGIVRLKYAFPIKCTGFEKNDKNEVVKIYATILNNYNEKIKGTINWVSTNDYIKVTTREYSHMFSEYIDTKDDDWINKLNFDSKKISNVYVEKSIQNGKIGDIYQFERIGYYCIDLDSTNSNLILNKTISLKESKKK